MAHHLVRQKNGLLAVYSDVTRTLIDSDATEEELIEAYANEAAEKARKATRDWIAGKGQHASVGHVLSAMHRGYAERQLSPAHRAEIQEARRILERPDLPEAVPEKQAEEAPAERALLGLLADLQELFGTGPDGECIFCPTTRPAHVVGHGIGCRIGAMLARADAGGAVRDVLTTDERRRTALVELLGRLGVSFRADDGGCQECFPAGPQAFFDYTAHKVACKARHVLDGLPADVVAEATARFPWMGEDEDEQP